MKPKQPTPTPIAVPQTPAERATLLTSLYYTKVSADDIARAMRTTKDLADDDHTKDPAS